MEKWKEVANAIGLIDHQIVALSGKLLSVKITKSKKLYTDYERLMKISMQLRSDLEDEMLRQNPNITDDEFKDMFYGKKF